jgi:tetratricopeptide (TPR) repeat protein
MAAYRAMHDAAALDGNLLAQARALIAQAALYLEWGDGARAREAAAQAEQLARLTGADLESARALLLLGEAAGRLERWPEAVDSLEQGIERARALDAPREVARGLATLAHLYGQRDDAEATAQATADLTAFIDQLAQREHPDEAEAQVRLARLLLQTGQSAEAQRHLTRALRLQRAVGRPGAEAETLRLLGLAVCRAGDGAAAIDYLEESAAQAEATGDRYLRLRCRLAIGEALLANGQYPAAEATLRQVIGAAEDRQRFEDWVDLPHAYGLLVEVLRRQGRRDEAQLLLERQRK